MQTLKSKNPNINLGKKVKDTITGFTGTITGYAQYLTGCDQYLVLPECEKSKKMFIRMDNGLTAIDLLKSKVKKQKLILKMNQAQLAELHYIK